MITSALLNGILFSLILISSGYAAESDFDALVAKEKQECLKKSEVTNLKVVTKEMSSKDRSKKILFCGVATASGADIPLKGFADLSEISIYEFKSPAIRKLLLYEDEGTFAYSVKTEGERMVIRHLDSSKKILPVELNLTCGKSNCAIKPKCNLQSLPSKPELSESFEDGACSHVFSAAVDGHIKRAKFLFQKCMEKFGKDIPNFDLVAPTIEACTKK